VRGFSTTIASVATSDFLAQLIELTTHCSDCAPARSSPLARPLPCVDRSIGERNPRAAHGTDDTL